MGCDINLHALYAYNGDPLDETSPYNFGYAPPVQGVTFLNKELTSFYVFNNSGAGIPYYSTDPEIAQEYYNFMQGYWKDNTPIVYGGNGHHSSTDPDIPTKYMYPGNPLDSSQWSEVSAGNLLFDRRGIGSFGTFNFTPATSLSFNLAYVYNRDCIDPNNCNNLSNIPTFLEDVAVVRSISNFDVAMENKVFIANEIPSNINYYRSSAIRYNSQLNYDIPIDSVVLLNAYEGPQGSVLTNWKIYQGQTIIELSNVKYETPTHQPVLLYLSLIFNPNTKSMKSYTIKYYSPGLLSINEYILSDIHIYPNPTSEQLYIKLEKPSSIPANLTICDVSGKILLQQQLLNNTNVIDVSFLSKGLYFVNVWSEKGYINKKLMKQ